ncbi:MAG: hypothetical protein KC736_01635 [Candidatus Moranbacteria bacterium]|nr:hypothetical protein [Candidatus Moranbacteria bacterium]
MWLDNNIAIVVYKAVRDDLKKKTWRFMFLDFVIGLIILSVVSGLPSFFTFRLAKNGSSTNVTVNNNVGDSRHRGGLADSDGASTESLGQGVEDFDGGRIAGVSDSVFFEFSEDVWDFNKSLEKEKDSDFYCIKERKGFETGEIWYKGKLSLGESVNFTYKLKKSSDFQDDQQEPKIILLYGRKGDDSAYFRTFVPDVDLGLIRFEDSFSGKSFTSSRLKPSLSVEPGTEIDLSYSVVDLNSNKASFSYRVSYIPLDNDHQRENKSFSFEPRLPWSNSKNTGQDFGFSAYPGTCIQIVGFEKSLLRNNAGDLNE